MKQRLDTLLVEKKLLKSRSQASDFIKRGKVKVSGKVLTKPATLIEEDAVIEIESGLEYVSRGGEKLAHALDTFKVSPQDKICLDIGSSTGGFTDCLLKRGAKKVYAVDVGKGQINETLKNRPEVIIMEQTDIRAATIPEEVDLTVIDVSFIPLSLILPQAKKLTAVGGDIIALVKPQFEVGKEALPKDGVVKSEEDRLSTLSKVEETGKSLGLTYAGNTSSPIFGGDGNKEYFIHFINSEKK